MLVRCVVVASLSIASTLFAASAKPADAWRIGWPSVLGPTGNNLPLVTVTPLVDDLSRAMLAWVSDDRSLGVAKTGSQTWVGSAQIEQYLGPDAQTFKGNWAGVIVVDGRVYNSSWVPTGAVFTAPYKTNKPYEKGDTELVPTRFRVDAEDIVVCLDADTGKVLWKASEPGGVIRAGGKRAGHQVAMASDGDRVFALGSTGRLFAYDATTGEKRWQSDVGPAHQVAAKAREAALAKAASGVMVIPEAPSWFTSLVVADGVLVTGDYIGKDDVGLRGYDATTGQLKWQLPNVISRYATPSVWRHDGKSWLLTGTIAGTLNLIDPQTGKPAWTLDGLGKNLSTLSPGERTVIVNVKPPADPKEKRSPGLFGAVTLSPAGATRTWTMPDEPANVVSTWMDDGARFLSLVRDGKVLVHTTGTKESPGRALLLDETTGNVLAEWKQGTTDYTRLDELVLWLGDRALVRPDHSHGASHGGRHPIVLWNTTPTAFAPVQVEGKDVGLDLADFDTAYEVMMHVPLVDGRMFERLNDGRIACYDLRVGKDERSWRLELKGANIGLAAAMPIRLWASGNTVYGGRAWLPDATDVALPTGTLRRHFAWERVDGASLKVDGDHVSGTTIVECGTHPTAVQLDARIDDAGRIAGTWSRAVPARAPNVTTAGNVAGQSSDVRGFPTPWLKESPWTRFGENAAGARTVVLNLEGAIRTGGETRNLSISFDHVGGSITRAAGAAFQYSQAWHEVDASAVVVNGRSIKGTVTVLLHPDWYLIDGGNAERGRTVAGTVAIDATVSEDSKTLSGTYAATWGIAWSASGAIEGGGDR